MRSISNRNEPERPRDYNDHALDALRYLIMSRFPPPSNRPRGVSMVTPLRQNKGAKGVSNNFPKNYQGDSMFGQFGDSLGVYNDEGGEWRQS